MTIRTITSKKKIENYVFNFGHRPFTTKKIAEETAVNYDTCVNYVREMQKKGKIKHIRTINNWKVYVKQQHKIKVGKYDFTPKRSILSFILDIIREKKITFVDLVKKIDLSERQAHRYIEVLFVLGCIRVESFTDYSVRPYHYQRFMFFTGKGIPENLKRYRFYHKIMIQMKQQHGIHHYE